MGCHTWSYVKYQSLPEERRNEIYQQSLDKVCREYDTMQSKTEEEDIQETKSLCPKIDAKFAEQWTIKHRRDLVRYYENRHNVEHTIMAADILLPKMINGVLYVQEGCDTPFRVFQYTDKTFIAKAELFHWLLTLPSHKLGYYDEKSNWVSGFTLELDRRIEDWYKRYGEDNCYFCFG